MNPEVGLTEFIRARLNETEAQARIAAEHEPMTIWAKANGNDPELLLQILDRHGRNATWPIRALIGNPDGPGSVRLELLPSDSARVLATVQAHRMLVDCYEVLQVASRTHQADGIPARAHQARITLLHIAKIYADHPDYRQEWKS